MADCSQGRVTSARLSILCAVTQGGVKHKLNAKSNQSVNLCAVTQVGAKHELNDDLLNRPAYIPAMFATAQTCPKRV